MNVKYIKQIASDEIKEKIFDLVIASSGYEVRASYISSVINPCIENKVVFAFNKYEDKKIRKINDSIFKDLNYKSIKSGGSDSTAIINYIDEFIKSFSGNTLSILVDYSSMTRIWYGSIINYFKHTIIENKTVKVYFSYSCAELHKPSEKEPKIDYFSPIDGFCSLSIPFVPTALITGLGYETNKSFGLKEFFDAEVLYLFYTEGNDFTKHIEKKNKELLLHTPSECKISYNMEDILLTKTMLYDLCLSLKNKYRIIIAPCGPKIFTLISFFVASEMDSVDVWRISSDNIDEDVDEDEYRVPNGKIISCEICYQ